MAQTYSTIASAVLEEIEIKKSRFRCALAPVDTEQAAREAIAARRKQEPAARHHCHAFVLEPTGSIQRTSDDGEPAGTAGVPMLEVLVRNELTDVVAVVSRHFGGVKLGAGGLVRAYSDAVAHAVESARIVRRQRMDVFAVSAPFDLAGKLENELRGSEFVVLDQRFDDSAHFDVAVPAQDSARFAEWLAANTAGAIRPQWTDERWV